MSTPRASNRAMFWRILRRLLGANRGRLFVILLALGAGAAVTAALLNLQVDAKRRLTTEFRTFGPNVVILPRTAGENPSTNALLNESILRSLPTQFQGYGVLAVPYLFLVADVFSADSALKSPLHMVVAGTDLPNLSHMFPEWELQRGVSPGRSDALFNHASAEMPCILGSKAAEQLQLVPFSSIDLQSGKRKVTCKLVSLKATGGGEDSQVFLDLNEAQELATVSSRISLIKISVDGTPPVIQQFIVTLSQKLPDVDIRPIRQFTEGEAKIYDRISGVLTATVAIVLLLTGLCVMAAMTNVAMERRNDVGLMKAIGGSVRRVLRLFLAEAALLGFAGGVIGAAAGIFLSMWLGKAVFGVAARPRLIVYPVSVALTTIVAILSAYPLRRLASIRPAAVFRGEA